MRTHSKDFAETAMATRSHETRAAREQGGRMMRHHTRSWHTDFTTADFEHPDRDR